MENSFQIHGSSRIIREKDGKLEEGKSQPWIKLSTKFRDELLKELKGVQLSVFLCLALHINENNESWPSLELIAKETGYSIRAVQYAIKNLNNRNWIKVNSGQKAGIVNKYALCGAVSFGENAPDIGLAKIANPNDRVRNGVPTRYATHCQPGTQPIANEVEPLSRAIKNNQLKDSRSNDCGRKNSIRKAFEEQFVESTGLQSPLINTQKQKKTAGELWWSPLREIAELVNWDEEKGNALIRNTVYQMRANKLTISSPKSILNVAKSIEAVYTKQGSNFGNTIQGIDMAKAVREESNVEKRLAERRLHGSD